MEEGADGPPEQNGAGAGEVETAEMGQGWEPEELKDLKQGAPSAKRDRPTEQPAPSSFGQMLEKRRDGKYVVRQRQQLKTAEAAEEFCIQLQSAVDTEKAAGATKETVPYELHLSDCAITSDGFQDIVRALSENDAFPGPDPKFPHRTLPVYLRLEHNYIEDADIKRALEDEVLVIMRKTGAVRPSNHKARLLVREDGAFQQKRGPPPAPENAPPPRRVNDDKGKGKGKGRFSPPRSLGSRDGNRDRRDSFRDGHRDGSRDGYRGYGDRGHGDRGYGDRGYGDRDRFGDRSRVGGAPPPWSSSQRPASRVALPSMTSQYRGGRPDDQYRGGRPDDRPRRYDEPLGSNGRGPRGAYGSSGAYGAAPRSDYGNGRPAPYERRDDRRGAPAYGNAAYGSAGKGSAGKGNGGGDRRGFAAAAKPAVPTSARQRSGNALPPNWEEHWSEEYQLSYFWNSKTGDSAWERPTS